ncbi:uncharacterized protein PG998_001738 [Apiospora kogelbergensis]|uniref:Uncharacterized protein n=1 Tax=Apiospora kogelbergensis TaxID=1337665 RepID=A0AAW0QP11_9PEZI
MAPGAKSIEVEAADEALPAYEAIAGPSSVDARPGAQPSPQASQSAEGLPGSAGPEYGGQGPTPSDPFNFPTADDLPPSYSPPTPGSQRPIAIPQSSPDVAAPFLQAYPPSLLSYGIPNDTWASFVKTINAFLTAKVGDQAIQHAADMGRKLSDLPKRYGKETATHAKEIGRGVSDSAKKGNYVAAGVGAIGGSIALPVGAALRLIGTAAALPFAVLGSISSKPKTPRERAMAYVAAANGKWFYARGLDARLLDSEELAKAVGLTVGRMADLSKEHRKGGAQAQMAALGEWIADVEVGAAESTLTLDWGKKTLWLVIHCGAPGTGTTEKTKKGKEKGSSSS